MRRRKLVIGDMAKLQRFQEFDLKLNTIEQALNSHQKCEIEEPVQGEDGPWSTTIFINGEEICRAEGRRSQNG